MSRKGLPFQVAVLPTRNPEEPELKVDTMKKVRYPIRIQKIWEVGVGTVLSPRINPSGEGMKGAEHEQTP
jgi:hypothetical protein